jgi:bifunctional DNA-binding transcriptional regulator/antitoxin component of YhaV-PrlF toxin-antitoxin module
MSQVRIRPKHQITLPSRIVAAAHLKPDDVLEVAYANGVVTLVPVSRKERKGSVMAYAGIARGIWGETTEAIEAGIKRDRESWER